MVETKPFHLGSPWIIQFKLTCCCCSLCINSDCRLTDECEQKVRTMESLDVCSPKFSFSRAVEVLASQSDRMLCDVLLDQTVLPGVGNIIKNEALFNSGLHPGSKVPVIMCFRRILTPVVSGIGRILLMSISRKSNKTFC